MQPFPTYAISTLPVQDVQLRSRRNLARQTKNKSTVIIEEEPKKEETPAQKVNNNQSENTTNSITQTISVPYSKSQKRNQSQGLI